MAVNASQQGEVEMTTNTFCRRLVGFCTTIAALTVITGMAVAQPTSVSRSRTRGEAQVTTKELSGTVVHVEGNQLVVQMSTGELQFFTPPPERRFIIDGKELRTSELKPGTKLNATYTEAVTPVTERTVESLSGKVWYAAGPSVILTLPSGENRKYFVKDTDPVEFLNAEGKKITVFDLRKGMNIKATRITEAPDTELATTTEVTGTAPAVATAQARPAPAKAATPARPAARPAAATAPEPAPEPAAAPPAQLPRTASPLPLAGLLGLLLTGAAFGIRRYRRS
jgi:hypothetical protein